MRLVSTKVPEPSVVPTPFTKKQPPPKDKPVSLMVFAAASKAVT